MRGKTVTLKSASEPCCQTATSEVTAWDNIHSTELAVLIDISPVVISFATRQRQTLVTQCCAADVSHVPCRWKAGKGSANRYTQLCSLQGVYFAISLYLCGQPHHNHILTPPKNNTKPHSNGREHITHASNMAHYNYILTDDNDTEEHDKLWHHCGKFKGLRLQFYGFRLMHIKRHRLNCPPVQHQLFKEVGISLEVSCSL